MADFKAGDVAQVISGGPKMTVTQVAESQLGEMTAWCVWFEGTKQRDGTFPVAALKIWTEPPRPTVMTGRAARG